LLSAAAYDDDSSLTARVDRVDDLRIADTPPETSGRDSEMTYVRSKPGIMETTCHP
jgi:hypothetical protein